MTSASLQERLTLEGFTFLRGPDFRALLPSSEKLTAADWEAFEASWNDLRRDTYMADGGRYRLRRYATLSAAAGDPIAKPEPHQPHYQSALYNPLNGGIERWFEPIAPEILTGKPLSAILGFGLDLFGRLKPGVPWHIEVHQFRIEAAAGQEGRPTPEGVHRDGVDYAMVLLIRRENIVSGVTNIFDTKGRALGSFTLTEPLDAALLDDARVLHGVTPIEPSDPSKPAHRDVLVATFRAR